MNRSSIYRGNIYDKNSELSGVMFLSWKKILAGHKKEIHRRNKEKSVGSQKNNGEGQWKKAEKIKD